MLTATFFFPTLTSAEEYSLPHKLHCAAVAGLDSGTWEFRKDFIGAICLAPVEILRNSWWFLMGSWPKGFFF